MMRVAQTEEKIVAMLHDVIEDSSVTLEELKEYGFPAEILTAVQLLTHGPEQTYVEYIEAIAQNPLATTVKLADLMENMNLSRLPQITEKDRTRYKRYKQAYHRLTAAT